MKKDEQCVHLLRPRRARLSLGSEGMYVVRAVGLRRACFIRGWALVRVGMIAGRDRILAEVVLGALAAAAEAEDLDPRVAELSGHRHGEA